MSAQVRFGLGARLGLSRLVDGDHTELVDLALAQPRHPRLQLVDGGHAVLVISNESIKPAAKLVLLLNDVVRDRAATVILGFVPTQGDGLVVKVNNLGFAGLAWRP